MTGGTPMAHRMVSYAQNFEDVILRRCFGDIQNGVYVDVGAHHPIIDSVTEAFYQLGWRGLNVDASHAHARAMARLRPEDVTRFLAVGDTAGETIFYEIPHTGLSTTSQTYAQRHIERGLEVIERIVERQTLTQLCDEARIDRIDFLKIDVEGDESSVIRGFDFAKWRPTIVLVEATEPNSRTRSDDWAVLLEAAGYKNVWFDGLNMYFVADEHAGLAQLVAAPPNVFDGFTLASVHAAQRYFSQPQFRRWLETVQPQVFNGDEATERACIVAAASGDWSAESVFPLAVARPPTASEANAWNDAPCADEAEVAARVALLMNAAEYRSLLCDAWTLPGLALPPPPIETSLRAAQRDLRLRTREKETLSSVLVEAEEALAQQREDTAKATVRLQALERQWLQAGDRLQQLAEENAALAVRADLANHELLELRSKLRVLEHERMTATERWTAAEAEKLTNANRLAEAERALCEAQTHARNLAETIKFQSAALDSTSREVEQRTQRLAAFEANDAASRQERDVALLALSEAGAALERKQQQLADTQAELAARSAELELTRQEHDALKAVAAEVHRELEAASARACAAEVENDRALRSLIDAEAKISQMLAAARAYVPTASLDPALTAPSFSNSAILARLDNLQMMLEDIFRLLDFHRTDRQFLLEQIEAALELVRAPGEPPPGVASVRLQIHVGHAANESARGPADYDFDHARRGELEG